MRALDLRGGPSPHARTRNGRPRGSRDLPLAARDPGDRASWRRRATWVGIAVYEARIAAGVSAEELAARLGKKAETVHALESGRRIPSLPTLIGIAKALGVSVASLATELDL